MTYAEAALYPNSRKVLLAALRGRLRLVGWTNDATYTNTWRVTLGGLRVVAVTEAGLDLTEQATVVLCNSNNESWFWDEANDTLYVNPLRPTANGAVLIAEVETGVGNHGKTPRGIGADQVYWSRLLGVPSFSLRVPDRFGEVGQVGGGTVVVANGDAWAERMGEIQWDGGSVSMKIGIDTF